MWNYLWMCIFYAYIYIKDSKLIKEIVNKHILDGITYYELSQEYQIKWQTIAQWVYQHKNFQWSFENKTRKSKNKSIDKLRMENEILKKFLSFQREWKQE